LLGNRLTHRWLVRLNWPGGRFVKGKTELSMGCRWLAFGEQYALIAKTAGQPLEVVIMPKWRQLSQLLAVDSYPIELAAALGHAVALTLFEQLQ